MSSGFRSLACAAFLYLLAIPVALADILILNDGKRIEGDITDKGNLYEVKTRFGTLTVDKTEVKKVVKAPAQMTAEAETCRKLARGMYDDALNTEDIKERNRKLTAGLELLEKALKGYTEAREVFTGSEYDYLDRESAKVVQEMRLYRDKMGTELTPKPAPPPPPEPVAVKPPDPVPVAPPPPAAGGTPPAGLLEPVKPPTTPPVAVPVSVTPVPKSDTPAAAKTPKELVNDLGSSEAPVRLAAIEQLGKSPTPDALAPLAELLRKEADTTTAKALGAALGAYDGAQLAKQAALKEAAQKGADPQRGAVIALFKKAGTEPGVRFLVDQFVANSEQPLRNDVASALKKHKALAVKPLLELCRKSAAKPDIQADCIKYLGIIGESKVAPPLLVQLLESDEARNIAIHALRKIDKPVIPGLIQFGLPGATHSRQWSGWLLQYFTGMTYTSQNATEWAKWWQMNKRAVEAEEAKWDKADEACDWMVDNYDWTEYDTDLAGNVRLLALLPGRMMNLYQSSRGRVRGQDPAGLDIFLRGGRRFGGPGGGQGGGRGPAPAGGQ
jgi:HEAT repeat protein